MNEVRRYVPRILRDDGMIEAQEVAHYTHLNLSQYVLASDYAALAARVQAVEEVNRIAAIKATVGDTEYSLRQQLAEAQGTVARLTDRIDLQCDEFQRISALTENDEIKGLCARAVKDIRQHVSVIQQRDQAEQQVARLREACEPLVAIYAEESTAATDSPYFDGPILTKAKVRVIQHALRETGA